MQSAYDVAIKNADTAPAVLLMLFSNMVMSPLIWSRPDCLNRGAHVGDLTKRSTAQKARYFLFFYGRKTAEGVWVRFPEAARGNISDCKFW
jgi:hypothetical protein